VIEIPLACTVISAVVLIPNPVHCCHESIFFYNLDLTILLLPEAVTMSIHNRSQYMAICWLTGSGLTRLLAQDWPGHMVSFLLCILGKVLIHCHWQTNSSPKGLPVTASRSNEPNWTALPNLPYSTTITAIWPSLMFGWLGLMALLTQVGYIVLS